MEDQLKKHPGSDEPSLPNFPVPGWQVDLGKKELQNIAEGNTELIEWSEAKKQLKQ
ncbi:hypothetical protein BH09BAC6_BH09BAC6_25770 [soil metagenome]|jgi:hypothetical protein